MIIAVSIFFLALSSIVIVVIFVNMRLERSLLMNRIHELERQIKINDSLDKINRFKSCTRLKIKS